MEQPFVFERNYYFDGRLLTKDDFIREQSYYIRKRKFTNSLIYSGGVISGLYVAMKDPLNLTVAAGAAIDYTGREIVVDREQNVTLDANLANGKKSLFLCLHYKETPTEETFNAIPNTNTNTNVNANTYANTSANMNANTSANTNANTTTPAYYNKFTESFELEWHQETESEFVLADRLSGGDFYWKRRIVYSGDDFTVTQRVPLYAKRSDVAELAIDIVKHKPLTELITVSYTCESDCLSTNKHEPLSVTFIESLHIPADRYHFRVHALVTDDLKTEGYLRIKSENFYIKLGDKVVKSTPDTEPFTVTLIDEDIRPFVQAIYLKKSMAEMLAEYENYRLYLAKVRLTTDKQGKTVIESVENLPFAQSTANLRLERLLDDISEARGTQSSLVTEDMIRNLVNEGKRVAYTNTARLYDILRKQTRTSAGFVTINVSFPPLKPDEVKETVLTLAKDIDKLKNPTLSDMARRHCLVEQHHLASEAKANGGEVTILPELRDVFPSYIDYQVLDIPMNLGLGYMDISCAAAWDQKTAYTGDTDIYVGESGVRTAVKLNMEKGTYTVSVRLTERTTRTKLYLLWTARKANNTEVLFFDQGLTLTPDLYMTDRKGGTVTFKAYYKGIQPKQVTWRSSDKAGEIDTSGVYKLPIENGIYEITASMTEGGVTYTANAYIIVYQPEKVDS